jgi:hypothetical protein
MGRTKGISSDRPPSIKVRVAARAPTTPPDIGASTKPEAGAAAWRAVATAREVVGSTVEQSIKRRGVSGRGVLRIASKTDLIWLDSGRAVIIVD